MARRQTARNTHASLRTGAPAGTVGLRHALVGGIAVLALLIQVAVPDLAMAARAQAGLPAGFLTAPTAADHCGTLPSDAQDSEGLAGGDQGGGTHDGSGHPVMDHDSLCAFCLVLGIHGLLPGSAVVRPQAVHRVPVAAPVAAGIRPDDHFLTCLNPRAPPV
ncbi:DUF2946 family protein [Azospirillum sp. A26]|uniref:DUF2946 family protein n=1 Tax=Azospirillum sp. A26 TaxID=3160607 RepID=UPI003670A096